MSTKIEIKSSTLFYLIEDGQPTTQLVVSPGTYEGNFINIFEPSAGAYVKWLVLEADGEKVGLDQWDVRARLTLGEDGTYRTK